MTDRTLLELAVGLALVATSAELARRLHRRATFAMIRGYLRGYNDGIAAQRNPTA